MHPFWLTFDSPRLEQLWRSDQIPRRRKADENFIFTLFFLLWIPAAQVYRITTRSWFDKLVLPALGLEIIPFYALILRLPGTYSRHRIWFLMAQKVLNHLPLCHLVMASRASDNSWRHFLTFDFLQFGKSIYMACNALLLPLSFKEHLFAQSLLLFIVLLYNPKMCRGFLSRTSLNSTKYKQVLCTLDTIFTPPLSADKLRCGGPAGDGLGQCLQVHAFVQIIVGFVLPSLVIFSMERRSRGSFQEQSAASKSRSSLLTAGALFLGTALLWRWLALLLWVRGKMQG